MTSLERNLKTAGHSRSVQMRRSVGTIVAFWGLMLLLSVGTGFGTQADVTKHARPGASVALLPNGQVLIAGGYDASQRATDDLSLVDISGDVRPLLTKMSVARSGHSSTVLPDGRIFIFGGYGTDGKLVGQSELLDTNSWTTETVSDIRLLPRAFHAATVLTDGTLVVVGGVGTGGELVPDIQVWDYRTGTTLSYDAGMSVPRQRHLATLLPNGSVRISGGIDGFGRATEITEDYDPAAHAFRIAPSSDVTPAPPTVEESIPADGANNVSVAGILAVRFNLGMSMSSLNGGTVVLHDASGNPASATVTGAEGGRLVFLIPSSPLDFGKSYSLVLDGVSDTAANPLPKSTIQFSTEPNPGDSTDEEWIPNPAAFDGRWRSSTGPSPWQKLPPLQAKAGITALSGQVLKLNGRPLSHVSLTVDNRTAFSDSTGRFLITNISAGHHVLIIDGAPGNHDDALYGRYEAGVEITSGTTNVLNYTIWMTKLDMSNAVNIASPTFQETVVTTPRLPGLALHLPPGTVIYGHDGRPVRQLTITAIPLDKPPFPLPLGVQVPIYFTIQPGGAYIKVQANSGAKGAWLSYPNTRHAPSGTVFNFWNYDTDAKGWFVYGHGQVDKEGFSIVPSPGVVIYELTGAMVGTAGGPFPFPPIQNPPHDGEPVDLSSGLFTHNKTDLSLADVLPIALQRTYRNNDNVSRAFGIGATLSYDMYMTGDQHPYSYQELVQPDGSRIRFTRISPGFDFDDAVYLHSSGQDAFYGAILSIAPNNGFGGFWTLRLKDGTTYWFPDSDSIPNYRKATPVAISDRYGNVIRLTRDVNGNLLRILSPNGRYIDLTYDAFNRITEAVDNIGRTVLYHYDDAGRLQTVTDANLGVTTYGYDTLNNMTTLQDARGITFLTNEYDSFGRVTKQTQADRGTYLFNWTDADFSSEEFIIVIWNSVGVEEVIRFRTCPQCSQGYTPMIASVDVTDPRGYVRRVIFDSMGREISDTSALDQPEQQVFTFKYNSDNTLQSETDALGHVTNYEYDANLNYTRITRLAESAQPVMSEFEYEPVFSRMTSATDGLGHKTEMVVDGRGNTTQVKDALGNGPSFSFNADGTVASVTDAIGNSARFEYADGDLVRITDPLGNVSTRFTDGAGRAISATDAGKNTSKTEFNPLNLVTKFTDPQGNETRLAYDPNGNLSTLSDTLHHETRWTYDNMDYVSTSTDPLQRQGSCTYDLNGNVSSCTDRKGLITTFSYDGLNRATLAGFNTVVNGGVTSYESTTTFSYDAGDRFTQAVDSAGGTITETYDDVNRLATETTSRGSISYTSDKAGRQTSMAVNGQSQATYFYDNGNRLTQITQGASSVTFAYDNANRRTSLSLSNGVSVGYDYDSDSQITDITYNFGATNLGNLTYSYDQLGRIIQTGGSFARTSLPGAITSATYDAANELISWNGTAISYDANGNMLSDGTNTFTWNARNQGATLNGISLQYDAFGRRTENTSGKSFLYDGANAIQEFSGPTLTASIWAGGLDEIFQRSDVSGVTVPLADALGSTLALVDSSGNIQTTYAYDPFGYTIIAGVPSSNPSQYTGRENEGNGLYYLRARYYSPVLGRFISPDPMGFGAGMNSYRYVGDDPVNASDPFGLQSQRKWYGLPQGWRAAVDSFNSGGAPGGQANFEIHVHNSSGEEVGTVSGANGWIGKHGEPGIRPPGIPEEVMNVINGINIHNMRQRDMLPNKGQLNIKGTLRGPGRGYLNPGRVLGVLNVITMITGEMAAAAGERALLGGRKNLSPEEKKRIICDAARIPGNPDYVLTTFGVMPVTVVGCGFHNFDFDPNG